MVKYWFVAGQGLPERATSSAGLMQDRGELLPIHHPDRNYHRRKKTSTGTVARGNHCSINSSLTGEDAILVMYVQSGSLSLFSALFVSHNEKQWTSDAPISNYWLITKCQGHGSTWNKLVCWIYSSKRNLKIKHSATLVCYAFMMWHYDV